MPPLTYSEYRSLHPEATIPEYNAWLRDYVKRENERHERAEREEQIERIRKQTNAHREVLRLQIENARLQMRVRELERQLYKPIALLP